MPKMPLQQLSSCEARIKELEAAKYELIPFGKDCPLGMVQVEFVGVDPTLRCGDYGWKPSESAFLEVWVDGQRFRIDVGNLSSFGSDGRGIHINGPMDFKTERIAVNAINIVMKDDAALSGKVEPNA